MKGKTAEPLSGSEAQRTRPRRLSGAGSGNGKPAPSGIVERFAPAEVPLSSERNFLAEFVTQLMGAVS